ncbi:MAG: hypothetical protein ACYDBQ_07450 [Thermoplasmatota archaeon]
MTDTEVNSATGRNGLQGNNCVMLQSAAHVIGGNATVTWTPAPAASPEMEIVFTNHGHVVAAASGSDRARISFGNLDVAQAEAEAPIAWQLSQSATAGAAVNMRGTLTLSLDYAAQGDMTPDPNWGCSIGH